MTKAVLFIFAVALSACSSCQPTPAPTPPPSPVVGPRDIAVYGMLVEAGCVQAVDGGASVVAQERSQFHDLGLDCLYDGGTVKSCNVPCE